MKYVRNEDPVVAVTHELLMVNDEEATTYRVVELMCNVWQGTQQSPARPGDYRKINAALEAWQVDHHGFIALEDAHFEILKRVANDQAVMFRRNSPIIVHWFDLTCDDHEACERHAYTAKPGLVPLETNADQSLDGDARTARVPAEA